MTLHERDHEIEDLQHNHLHAFFHPHEQRTTLDRSFIQRYPTCNNDNTNEKYTLTTHSIRVEVDAIGIFVHVIIHLVHTHGI